MLFSPQTSPTAVSNFPSAHELVKCFVADFVRAIAVIDFNTLGLKLPIGLSFSLAKYWWVQSTVCVIGSG